MSRPTFGPWEAWNGTSDGAVPPACNVQVQLRLYSKQESAFGSYTFHKLEWEHTGGIFDIIAFRRVKS